MQTEVRAANTWGVCRSCNTCSLLQYHNDDDNNDDDNNDNNNDDNNDDNNNVDDNNNNICSIAGLAHRHHMCAIQVSSLQTGLFRAS